MTEPILQVDDAKVWFGGIRAVDGVTFSLDPGKVYGLVGPNGSGKTTLVNAVSRFTSLTSGAIRFDGQDVTKLPAFRLARAGVSRSFQSIRLLPTLTVLENIKLGADSVPGAGRVARRAHSAAVDKAADEALDRLGLGDVRNVSPSAISYGVQRKVEIARALASGCRLLLLDEPVAGMNRSERDGIAQVVQDVARDGLTVLVIEHDLRLMLQICDHLYVMNFGTIIAEGKPHEAAASPAVQEAYLGKKHAAA